MRSSAGQADCEEQARHEESQEISDNNQASADEERSPGTRRTDQHEHDDYTTQTTAGRQEQPAPGGRHSAGHQELDAPNGRRGADHQARHSQGQHVAPGGQPAHHGQ